MTEEPKKVIDRLQQHINLATSELLKYPEGELRRKPAPDKWSKKELLGHLIDSAANNHHRFIKIQFLPQPFFVEGYAQNDWVRIQEYNEKDTEQLVNLWKVYNEHILFIIQNTPDKNLKIKIFDNKGRLVRTLANNQASGSSGSIIFDGIGDDGQGLRIGIYIIFLEAINEGSGVVESMKTVVVVARKL